jgi:hypothetical protein
MEHHTTHQPGTVAGCSACHRMAYEPGWYASLMAFEVDAAVSAGTLDRRVAV